jgi:hypothetical protein
VPGDAGEAAVQRADVHRRRITFEPGEQRRQRGREAQAGQLAGGEAAAEEGRQHRRGLLSRGGVGGNLDALARENVRVLDRLHRQREHVGGGHLLQARRRRHRGRQDTGGDRRQVPGVEQVLHQVDRCDHGGGQRARRVMAGRGLRPEARRS